MNTKKTFGYIFIVLATILGIAIVEQYHAVDSAVKGIFMVFTGELDTNQTGRAIGRIAYWVAHFMATFFLWIYGKKWIE
jgi:hypothetical protein